MANYLRFNVLAILTWFSLSYGRVIQKDMLVYFKQELVDGRIFKHRMDLDGVKKREQFMVDDKSVTQNEFDQLISEAEKNEILEKRSLERQQKHNELLNRQKLQIKLLVQDLKKALENMQRQLKPLLDDRLEKYLAFSGSTIANMEELSKVISELLPKGKKVIAQPISDQDLTQLEDLKTNVHNKTNMLKQLFNNTLEKVIEEADDTQLLKELLVLIS